MLYVLIKVWGTQVFALLLELTKCTLKMSISLYVNFTTYQKTAILKRNQKIYKIWWGNYIVLHCYICGKGLWSQPQHIGLKRLLPTWAHERSPELNLCTEMLCFFLSLSFGCFFSLQGEIQNKLQALSVLRKLCCDLVNCLPNKCLLCKNSSETIRRNYSKSILGCITRILIMGVCTDFSTTPSMFKET